MLKIELLDYRIRRLDMLNKLNGSEEGGEVEISDGMDFSVDFKFKDNLAVAVLTECLEMEGSNKFHIELTLEGFFHVEGIKSDKLQKEAHVRCYDGLHPYADQLIRILSLSSGILGLALKKRFMDPKSVNIGKKPKPVKDGKVIDFQAGE